MINKSGAQEVVADVFRVAAETQELFVVLRLD